MSLTHTPRSPFAMSPVGAPWLPDVRPVGELVGVESIVHAHWREYGRNYYTRYDYEEVPTPPSQAEAHIIVNGTLARQVDAEMANMLVARLLGYGEEFKAAGFGPERPKARALLLSLDAPCLRKSSRILLSPYSRCRENFSFRRSMNSATRIPSMAAYLPDKGFAFCHFNYILGQERVYNHSVLTACILIRRLGCSSLMAPASYSVCREPVPWARPSECISRSISRRTTKMP